MEKLPGFAVFRAAFPWSDIGSWDAWAQLAPRLEGENRGRADLLALDSRGNVVHAADKLVALVGVEDLVVVDTSDALLVCRKQDAQRIREVTDRLAVRERKDLI
jgi:mannose-1-phosphate guanylyltransferase